MVIRRAEVDQPKLDQLSSGALDWDPGGTLETFCCGQYHENAAVGALARMAASPAGDFVGLQGFIRWRLDSARGPLIDARALDTATHADYRGQGRFLGLALGAEPGFRWAGVPRGSRLRSTSGDLELS